MHKKILPNYREDLNIYQAAAGTSTNYQLLTTIY
jgi:hypothetical protein